MPKLKVDHIVSFSSEDPVHVANNLLSSDPAKKWKCQNAGEKQASVVLQLEKASVISSIDIGNENSAYVEVLASRSNSDDDYKVLLVMSSFMTPLEARQGTNINKVRMFTRDQLSKPECDQKWLRIKIVCTQPFNRHMQYGLSFVNFYTPEEKVNGTPVHTTVGKFAVRPESPTSSLGIGSLFARRKELQTPEPLKGAAAIREASSASSLTQQGTPTCKPKLKIPPSSSLSSPSSLASSNTTPKNNSNSKNDSSDESSKPLKRNRNELLYSKDEEEPNEKIDKIIQKKQEEVNKAKQLVEEETPKKLKRETKTPKAGSASADDETPKKARKDKATPKAETSTDSAKRKNKHSTENEPKKQKVTTKERRPFSQLLKGVFLVISGIQNPDRANLRTMALEMGAKYKPNWEDDTCTHLICAFTNTPKFQQVKGKGKIVKKTWIEDCYSQRKRLPWRRYALDKSDQGKDESEDEIWEEIAEDPPLSETVNVSDESTDDEGGLDYTKMDERIARLQAVQQNATNNDESNTKKDDEDCEEDKDEQKPSRKQKESSPKKTDDDIFTCSTEDEEEDDDDFPPPGNTEISKILPDLFNMKTFLVDETLGEETCRLLERYIIAYNGIVTESSGDDVDFVIGSESSVADLTDKNPNAVFLRPDWVCECHITQSYVPVDAYKL